MKLHESFEVVLYASGLLIFMFALTGLKLIYDIIVGNCKDNWRF